MEMPSAPPMGSSETETIGTVPQNHRVFFSGSSNKPDITEAELNSGILHESLYTYFDQGWIDTAVYKDELSIVQSTSSKT